MAPVSISVIDNAGFLVGFARVDGTFLGTVDVAHRKARTAALFQIASGELGPSIRPGRPAFRLDNSNDGLVAVGGGLVLRDAAGSAIGAVGVSGASVKEDEAIAQAAAAAAVGV